MMQKQIQIPIRILSGLAAVTLLLCSTTVMAATAVGQARAVSATVLGVSTVLADTGTLASDTDARDNSLPDASIVSSTLGQVLSADVLHTATTAGVDQVDSSASLADLSVSVGTGGTLGIGDVISVSLGFVRSEAQAVSGGTGTGRVMMDGLTINGLTTTVTGEANQVIPLVGGEVIINEHKSIPGGIKVNALHIIVDGVADLVIGSATAALPTQ